MIFLINLYFHTCFYMIWFPSSHPQLIWQIAICLRYIILWFNHIFYPYVDICMSESISSWLVCTCSVTLSVWLQSKRWVSGSLWVNHERSREAAKVMHACLHLFPLPWLLSPQVSVKWILLQYCSSHISPDRALDLARENGAEMQDLFNALFPLLLSAQFQYVCRCPWGTMVCHYWSRSITWCF